MRVRLNDHGRNVPDDVLKLLRANGGIVMVTFVPGFLTPTGKATLGDVANHMDYMRKVAGADHVGIGSDFDGIQSVPVGLEDVSKYPRTHGGAAAARVAGGRHPEGARPQRASCDAKGRRGCGPSAEGARAVHSDDRAARSLIKSQSVADIRRAGLYGPPRTTRIKVPKVLRCLECLRCLVTCGSRPRARIHQVRVALRKTAQRLRRHAPICVGPAEAHGHPPM